MNNGFHVFEVTTPGTELNYSDKDWCHSIELIIRNLQYSFVEANITLNLFEQSGRTPLENIDETELEARWDQKIAQKAEIRKTVETEIEPTRENEEQISYEVNCRYEREKWRQGIKPSIFTQLEPFIHAKSFVYSLDKFDKFLSVLSREPNVPEAVTLASEKMIQLFPNLRSLRNTAQHLEDRTRGLGAGRNPKPMELKPISTGTISFPLGGSLAIDNLEGSLYGSTTADGTYVQIDISSESLMKLRDVFHEVVNSFEWTGPRRNAMI